MGDKLLCNLWGYLVPLNNIGTQSIRDTVDLSDDTIDINKKTRWRADHTVAMRHLSIMIKRHRVIRREMPKVS